MLHPTIQNLIARLGDLTDRGEIRWQPFGADAYRFETEGYMVEVSPEPRFRILDSGEREIERADAAVLSAPREGDWIRRVSELAGAARRTVTGEAAPAKPVPAPAPATVAVSPVNTGRAMFGAIESFDVSRKAIEAARPSAVPAAKTPNPYKPWA